MFVFSALTWGLSERRHVRSIGVGMGEVGEGMQDAPCPPMILRDLAIFVHTCIPVPVLENLAGKFLCNIAAFYGTIKHSIVPETSSILAM